MKKDFERMRLDLIQLKIKARDSGRQDKGFLKYPSPYILMQYANGVVEVFENCKIKTDVFKNWFSWVKMELEEFKADLEGELHVDYDNRLKRYRTKWNFEKDKIDEVISLTETKLRNAFKD